MSEENLKAPEKRTYKLQTIYFYLTSDCNLRCRHCWISPNFQSAKTSSAYLPVELFRSIIAEAKPLGLQSVKLTGGEPLLHPQILDILDIIRNEGLMVNIETNGVLCTPEIAKAIAACKVTGVSISLDGPDAEAHEWVRGVDGCFEDTLQGIKNLITVGIKPQIIMTLMRHNIDRVEEMIGFAKSIGARTVKLNVLMPTSRGKTLYDMGDMPTIEELVALGERMESEIFRKSDLPVYHSHPIAFRHFSNMFGKNGHGCAVCNIMHIIGVLSDGTYALCGIGEATPELTYGNARTRRLADMWENAPFLVELREGMPSRLQGICSECLLKNICLGSCVAQNYYRKGSLWAPFWYCEKAKNLDLFPSNKLTRKIY